MTTWSLKVTAELGRLARSRVCFASASADSSAAAAAAVAIAVDASADVGAAAVAAAVGSGFAVRKAIGAVILRSWMGEVNDSNIATGSGLMVVGEESWGAAGGGGSGGGGGLGQDRW